MATKKIVHYIRHFEALHNIEPYNYGIHDPDLSSLGETQAASTIDIIKTKPSIDLIICSPLIRALHTYLLIFDDPDQNQHSRMPPLIIHPDLQEVCIEPCDTGSPIDDLKTKFPMLIDELKTFGQTFGDIEWRDKINSESIYSPKRIKERAERFRYWLMNRTEQSIVVISHNLMLIELLQNETQKSDLKNGEIKTVEYH